MALSRRRWLTRSLAVGSVVLLAEGPGAAGANPNAFAFAFDKQNPFEWLAALVLEKANGRPAVVIGDAPKGWLKPHHVDALLEMINSSIACASVSSMRSSNLADNAVKTPSTVGHEALYLVASYRHGLFPMSHRNSSIWPMDPEELKKWWLQQKVKDARP